MLVLGSFVIQIANLLNLVMIDGHSLIVDGGDVLFGGGSLIGLLEADEGVELLVLISGMKSQTLNLTERLKVLSKHLLCDVLCEALDVQVASLL